MAPLRGSRLLCIFVAAIHDSIPVPTSTEDVPCLGEKGQLAVVLSRYDMQRISKNLFSFANQPTLHVGNVEMNAKGVSW